MKEIENPEKKDIAIITMVSKIILVLNEGNENKVNFIYILYAIDVGASEQKTLEEVSRPTATHNWGWCSDWCDENPSASQKLQVLFENEK